MWIIKHTNKFLVSALVIILTSISAMMLFGFNLSVDFSGGSLLEISYNDSKPTQAQIVDLLIDSGFAGSTVQEADETSFIIKTKTLSDEKKTQLDQELTFGGTYSFEEIRFKSLSPTISEELRNKSLWALGIVAVATVLFIAIAFNGVTVPVSSLRYGLVAIITLLHDIIVPAGVFAILGAFFIDYQLDVLFVTALLAILGLSINDTIVVFDRIRENLKLAKEKGQPIVGDAFKKIVGTSLNQTFRRSFITSFSTVIVLIVLFFVGGESTKPFALVLGIGQIAGTYSSLFIASPLLVWIEEHQKTRPAVEETVEKETA